MRRQRLVRVYTCQNVKLLEISCHGSYFLVNHTVPFSVPYQQTVTIGKCEDPVFEDQLLQTALKLHDQHGSLMSPGIVQQIDSDVKACTGRNFINSISFYVTLPFVNKLCKQLGSRSGPINVRFDLDSNCQSL